MGSSRDEDLSCSLTRSNVMLSQGLWLLVATVLFLAARCTCPFGQLRTSVDLAYGISPPSVSLLGASMSLSMEYASGSQVGTAAELLTANPLVCHSKTSFNITIRSVEYAAIVSGSTKSWEAASTTYSQPLHIFWGHEHNGLDYSKVLKAPGSTSTARERRGIEPWQPRHLSCF